MRRVFLVTLVLTLGQTPPSQGVEPDAAARVRQVVAAAGGEAKLLKRFRMTERLNVSSDPQRKANERTTVLEPPREWWWGKKERVSEDKEPAIFLVWAWTLGVLVDPASQIEVVPDIVESEQPAFGLRVSGTIDPPMEIYFDQGDSRLVRIDWRSDIHRFSEWRETDGVRYPARCVGYRKSSGKPWYFTEITELERLPPAPAKPPGGDGD